MDHPTRMSYTQKYRARLLASHLPTLRNKKVIDIGCGNGIVAVELQRRFGCRIIGTDVLDYLVVKLPFKKMINEDRLDFSDKEFDTAVCVDVLHHMVKRTQERIIKEALRCANQLVIIEDEPRFLAKFLDKFVNLFHNPKMHVPLSHRSFEQWKKLFDKIGCEYQAKVIKTPWWYPVTHFLFVIKK